MFFTVSPQISTLESHIYNTPFFQQQQYYMKSFAPKFGNVTLSLLQTPAMLFRYRYRLLSCKQFLRLLDRQRRNWLLHSLHFGCMNEEFAATAAFKNVPRLHMRVHKHIFLLFKSKMLLHKKLDFFGHLQGRCTGVSKLLGY